MPTIYRLKSKDLYDIAKLLQPDLSDETLKGYNADKLKLIISEWLLLNHFSTLHLFEKNANSAWIHPKENQCDCCWKFRVGRRKLSIPSIDAIDRNPSPRESQMIYNGGPWVMVSDDQNKQGTSKIRVRSHLLHTTYENDYNGTTNDRYKTESKCCSLKQIKNSCMACLCFECCRI